MRRKKGRQMTYDVGIDLNKPAYDKPLLRAADTAYWEVLYDDGTVLCEAAGATYSQIDRSKLSSFRIIHHGEIVFELAPTRGKSGHHLVYRRRSMLGSGQRAVVYIIGLAPDGPFYVIDLDNGQYYDDTANILPSLEPMPGEPDGLLTSLSLLHLPS